MTVRREPIVETFVCVQCGKNVSRVTKRIGGLPPRFCNDVCSQLWRNADESRKRKEQGWLPKRGERICPRCHVGRLSSRATHCWQCKQEAKRNMGKSREQRVPDELKPLPKDFAQRMAAIDARVDPDGHAVVCWCGADAEVQGFFDAGILETVAWEVCQNGHYTRVERRRSA